MKESLLRGIKKYKNYLLIALAVVIFAVVLALSLTLNANNSTTVDGPSDVVNTTPVNFVMPVANATISKSYKAEELQYNKTLNCWEIHKGLDILVTSGENVLACYDGTVSNIYTNYLEGTTIEITHNDGLISVYQGLSDNTTLTVGDVVSSGDVIGVALGLNNETEDGSHIHFELIKDGEKIDPLNYIEIGTKD